MIWDTMAFIWCQCIVFFPVLFSHKVTISNCSFTVTRDNFNDTAVSVPCGQYSGYPASSSWGQVKCSQAVLSLYQDLWLASSQCAKLWSLQVWQHQGLQCRKWITVFNNIISKYSIVLRMQLFGFLASIIISVLVHHYCDVYVDCYSFWNTDLDFWKLGDFCSTIAQLLGCCCPWTLFVNIGSNILQSNPFMSNVYF